MSNKVKININKLLCIFMLITCFCMADINAFAINKSDEEYVDELNQEQSTVTTVSGSIPTISYNVHVQSYGWINNIENGNTAGTTGESKRIEAISLNLASNSNNGDITYRVHVQSYGWQDWVSNNQVAGTTGESKRLEAIEIKLTGDLAQEYDVLYRTHVQSYGWTGWVKNGITSGSVGQGKRLEAIQIKLVKKNTDSSVNLSYKVHAQSYGWMNSVNSGQIAGTTGQSKRLEAIEFNLETGLSGDINYSGHIQSIGWGGNVSSGMVLGTTGQGKRIEAIKLSLSGEVGQQYDIYYRVHSQSFGWLGWAKNGEAAGTEGLSRRIEAIQVVLVNKGANAPGSTGGAFYNMGNLPGDYAVYINKKQNCITVYKGNIPVKAMVCSTGNATPAGTFSAGGKQRWGLMFGNCWAQYTTHITGNILMHSVPYAKPDNTTLFTDYYNKLGTTCSMGCIRLSCADAKWVYDNIKTGTKIVIYDADDPGPLGKPTPIKITDGSTIDPTDVDALRR